MKIPEGYTEHGTGSPVIIVNLLISKFIKPVNLLSHIETRGRKKDKPIEVKPVQPPKPTYLLYRKDGVVWTAEELLKKPLIDLVNMGEVEYYFYPVAPQDTQV